MAAERRSTCDRAGGRQLHLPPPFRLVPIRESGDAFDHASRHAAELGAGALVFVGRFDLAEFAVVLEPEEPFRSSRRIFYAGMSALADALAAAAPPEKPIAIAWPDAIHIDGGLIGGGRLGWPAGLEEGEVPPWLVFGATIRTVFAAAMEPGLHALATTLEDEGFGEFGAEALAERFARYLMAAIDCWQQGDFGTIASSYLGRLARARGARFEIAANGDLTVAQAGSRSERRALGPALAQPSWRDPASGEPRL